MTPFIVIEGIDGAGTTTQTADLVARLIASGHAAHATREPTDGPIGRLLREFLAGRHTPGEPVAASTFALLFAADRVDHWQREIDPARRRGQVVVSDRYVHSSLAYQGSPSTRAWVGTLNQDAPTPELTIYLRVRPEIAATRRAGRTEAEIFENLPTQIRVAAAYDAVMQELSRQGQPIAILDGELSKERVGDDIWQLVQPLLQAKGAS